MIFADVILYLKNVANFLVLEKKIFNISQSVMAGCAEQWRGTECWRHRTAVVSFYRIFGEGVLRKTDWHFWESKCVTYAAF